MTKTGNSKVISGQVIFLSFLSDSNVKILTLWNEMNVGQKSHVLGKKSYSAVIVMVMKTS